MKVFLPEPYAIDSVARLRVGKVFETVEGPGEAEVLLIRSGTRITENFLATAPNLKLIVTATSGFDHIDWQACQKRNIVVSHTPEANATSTAELTIFLMMALLRNTFAQMKNATKGDWRKGLTRGEGLEGKTLGIVGLGRVGSIVAKIAHVFNMKLIGFDPYVEPKIFEALNVERVAYVELLRSADIVTFHVPLTKETRSMINKSTIEEMTNHAYIVNASRGKVVDESEVLVALRNGKIQGAAFDVLEREPPFASNELLRHPKALVSPHVGAFTKQAFEKASHAAVDRAFLFAEGKTVPDTLPLNTAWFQYTV
jgi:D-3-phosphoglycerate dehydrogenase / 2-oxoglutarate reductase